MKGGKCQVTILQCLLVEVYLKGLLAFKPLGCIPAAVSFVLETQPLNLKLLAHDLKCLS
jgi:hypothetical protein